MNRGVDMLLTSASRATRWGHRFTPESQRAEMKGLNGTLNVEFTGPDGGGWHLTFDDGRARLERGLAESARATVKIRPEDYLAMIAGDLAYSVARMTGKVRMSGDGNFGFVFGAMVENIRSQQSAPGLRGWVARRMISRALHKGGYAMKRPAEVVR